jgi:uncharacterized protein (TIGR02678 family)
MTEEQRDAARQLLRSPLVLASRDPEGHRRIRRNVDTLTTMFRTYLGYRLVVDARFARLFKAGLGCAQGRPLIRSSKTAFSPRDYTYLSLLCSVLFTVNRQILLSSVVDDVKQAATEAGVVLGEDSRPERRSLVHALHQLVDWGAVTEDAGSISAFAEDPSKEALLWVEGEIIRNLLTVPLREVDDPEELVRLAGDPGPDAVRQSVRRKMVEEPVVMLDELPEVERIWLRQYQRREAQILEDNFGLSLEIRAEGVAAFDPRDELTDVVFPREGTLGQASLLAVAELARLVPPGGSSALVPPGALAAIVAGLLGRYGRRWSKEYVEHPERLTPDVEDLLLTMGLLVVAGDSLRLRAIAARYAPEPEEIEAPASLFSEES